MDLSGACKHFTTGPTVATSKARYTNLVAEAITRRAKDIGMNVNCKKTQLLIISPPNGYINKAYINLEDQKIMSEESLKLLGFVFGQEPNVNAHVKEIRKKFRGRFWSLIQLRKSGFCGRELMSLFNVFVRPVIEFCSMIYHPLLTVAQSEELEKMQKQVAKLAFGREKSYAVICAEQGIESLKQRREKYIDNFVMKTLNSARFSSSWFPLRDPEVHVLRGRRPYRETRARTVRYYV